jgi:hypothetical protein
MAQIRRSLRLPDRSVGNALVAAIRTHGGALELRAAVVLIRATGGVLLASEILYSAASWVRTAQPALLQDYISGRFSSAWPTLPNFPTV